ncbi:CLUMA_CG002730, isoform A [Clunio marinus]|uniref:CLUMA_CG002730, isoform A n=1 Tax=Clunio marinus TaxID=568069 RepID=A0A1J1HLY2_9DIPT|nr:CLUMA_CG002730, isoform A [Clunio marinus]
MFKLFYATSSKIGLHSTAQFTFYPDFEAAATAIVTIPIVRVHHKSRNGISNTTMQNKWMSATGKRNVTITKALQFMEFFPGFHF